MKGNGARAGAFVLFLKATSSHPHKAWAFCGLGNLFLGGHSTASLFFPQQRGALSVNGRFTGVWEEHAFSGHSSAQANTQRLGVVTAFWEPGVVALHGTEAPRAWGGRMQEATRAEVPLQWKGRVMEPPGFYLESLLHTGRPCSCPVPI